MVRALAWEVLRRFLTSVRSSLAFFCNTLSWLYTSGESRRSVKGRVPLPHHNILGLRVGEVMGLERGCTVPGVLGGEMGLWGTLELVLGVMEGSEIYS
ncbi:hypothetical protein E2C01_030699 [Portunus trituberculatus]|uniref:Uncharacterized protein n=1 Tax=Portunus trituberculatus TaxID=210409 RepID=A0A5B7EVK9_PORTR|nr:hypothetical protein [Portunus trituberculatus]